MTKQCVCGGTVEHPNRDCERCQLIVGLTRMTVARDCLSEELKRIEAAVDAAGGTKFEATPKFIERLKAQHEATLRILSNFVEAFEIEGLMHSEQCGCDLCEAYRAAVRCVKAAETLEEA